MDNQVQADSVNGETGAVIIDTVKSPDGTGDVIVTDNSDNVSIPNGGISFFGGSFSSNTAQLYYSSSLGAVFTGKGGTAYDLVLADSSGQLLLANPVGTYDMVYPHSLTKVGIGTTSPSSLFHLYGSDARLRIQDDDDSSSYFQIDDSNSSITYIRKFTNSGAPYIDIEPMVIDGSSMANIRLFRQTNTTGTKRLSFFTGAGSYTKQHELASGADSYVCADNGDFGNGTTSPAYESEVYRNDRSSRIYATTDGDYFSSLGLRRINGSSKTNCNWYFTIGSTGLFLIKDGTNDITTVTITPSTGAVKFDQYGAGSLQTDASGNITASSDASLKDIQGELNYTLDDIAKLQGKIWKWNKESGLDQNAVYGGFIADEVELIIPEAVHKKRYQYHPDEFETYSEDVKEIVTIEKSAEEIEQETQEKIALIEATTLTEEARQIGIDKISIDTAKQIEQIVHYKDEIKLDEKGEKILKKAAYTETINTTRTLDDRVILAAYAGAFKDIKNKFDAMQSLIDAQADLITALDARIKALETAAVKK